MAKSFMKLKDSSRSVLSLLFFLTFKEPNLDKLVANGVDDFISKKISKQRLLELIQTKLDV
jgi:hypothetical protein